MEYQNYTMHAVRNIYILFLQDHTYSTLFDLKDAQVIHPISSHYPNNIILKLFSILTDLY